tara:strand:- start:103 stop:957 length:855 start_codon:yes stop_codon:yes gene_type:complete
MEKLNPEDFKDNIEQSFDYDKMFEDCFVDLDVVIKRPPAALSIGTYEYNGNVYDLPVHTYGEFSATVAPSKTKKSFYKSALIASYIGGTSNKYFENIKTHRDADYYIVDIDTEQGAYYAQNVFRRVMKMTGGNYKNYLPFAMRSKTPEERVAFVDALLEDEKYKGKIKFISIDGIADLVENTNDIIMSAKIAQRVLKWTDEYGVHLHTIIHKLMNVEKPTGHLGSYILKKAETVVFLEKEDANDNNSDIIVKHKYSRGIEFKSFKFNIDENGLPYYKELEDFNL